MPMPPVGEQTLEQNTQQDRPFETWINRLFFLSSLIYLKDFIEIFARHGTQNCLLFLSFIGEDCNRKSVDFS